MTKPGGAAGEVIVLAAYDIPSRRRVRVVFAGADDRLGLAEGRTTADGTKLDAGVVGEPLFPPLTLAEMRHTAERAIAGESAVISHPKTILVLATALVAVLETICNAEESTWTTNADGGSPLS